MADEFVELAESLRRAAADSIQAPGAKVRFVLKDVGDHGRNAAPVAGVLEQLHDGVGLSFPGYGTARIEPRHGPPVIIESRGGVPTLVVWSDIRSQEPTHAISLSRASETLRSKDTGEEVSRG